jgi:hypothetical protein
MACQLTFSLRLKPLKILPLIYSVGTMPSANVLKKSLFCSCLAGGVAKDDSRSVTLFAPNVAGTFNPEPTAAILLQPLNINFQCDKITLDVLGWANVNPDRARFILAVDHP